MFHSIQCRSHHVWQIQCPNLMITTSYAPPCILPLAIQVLLTVPSSHFFWHYSISCKIFPKMETTLFFIISCKPYCFKQKYSHTECSFWHYVNPATPLPDKTTLNNLDCYNKYLNYTRNCTLCRHATIFVRLLFSCSNTSLWIRNVFTFNSPLGKL